MGRVWAGARHVLRHHLGCKTMITSILQIELMVHRRLLQDDGLGVMEPLNETDAGCSPYPTQVPDWTSLCAPLPACTRSGGGVVSRGLFMLTLEPPARAARVWRPLAHANYMQVSAQWSNLCRDCTLFSFFMLDSSHHTRPPPSAHRCSCPKFLPSSHVTHLSRRCLFAPLLPPPLY